MNMHIVPPAEPPATPPVEQKRRIISLTHRAPIFINEAEWPVIAEGLRSEDDGPPWGWSMQIKVRRNEESFKRGYGYSHIVHARYMTYDETNEESHANNQTVRVGRLLRCETVLTEGIAKQILEVGEELRVRILNELLQKYVQLMIDDCFGALAPLEV